VGRTAEEVDEGVAIATSAARLVVKNRILVDTIGGDGAFVAEHYAENARKALINLAIEAEAAVEHIEELRKSARGRFSDPRGSHDYRERDMRNLRRRQKQSAGLAAYLRALIQDDAAILELVNQARKAAWEEVQSNLHRRLFVEGMRADEDPNYGAKRDERMKALKDVDLAALAKAAKRKGRVQKPA
jgi:hypothetical protein